MGEKLSRYGPKKSRGVEIEIRDELAPVVERISQVLPPELLWDLFSSTPSETDERIVFPYCKPDSKVLTAGSNIDLLLSLGHEYGDGAYDEWYKRATRRVFSALVWVEIGFEGLENLARSRASVSWTLGVKKFVDDDQRAREIMTSGKKMYEECLKYYASFREKFGVGEDFFTQYKVEYLLEKFKEPK